MAGLIPQQQESSGKWKCFLLGRLITAWISLQIKACRDWKEPQVAQTELFPKARLVNGPSHPPPAPGCPRMPHQTPLPQMMLLLLILLLHCTLFHFVFLSPRMEIKFIITRKYTPHDQPQTTQDPSGFYLHSYFPNSYASSGCRCLAVYRKSASVPHTSF